VWCGPPDGLISIWLAISEGQQENLIQSEVGIFTHFVGIESHWLLEHVKSDLHNGCLRNNKQPVVHWYSLDPLGSPWIPWISWQGDNVIVAHIVENHFSSLVPWRCCYQLLGRFNSFLWETMTPCWAEDTVFLKLKSQHRVAGLTNASSLSRA